MIKKAFFFLFFLFSYVLFGEEVSPRLHVCTMASSRTKALNQLLHSGEFHSMPIKVLGLHEPFSFGKKLKDVKKHLKTIPDCDVVLFVDAYDVLITSSEQTILDTFFSMNAPIIFSVETACHPFPHLAPYYPTSPTRFRYINTGGYIGYAKNLKEMFKEIGSIPNEIDDQGLISVYYLYNPDRIKLDYFCQLFLSLYQVNQGDLKLDLNRKSVYCLITQSSPCVIHGNSTGKQLYQEIYDKLFAYDL